MEEGVEDCAKGVPEAGALALQLPITTGSAQGTDLPLLGEALCWCMKRAIAVQAMRRISMATLLRHCAARQSSNKARMKRMTRSVRENTAHEWRMFMCKGAGTEFWEVVDIGGLPCAQKKNLVARVSIDFADPAVSRISISLARSR